MFDTTDSCRVKLFIEEIAFLRTQKRFLLIQTLTDCDLIQTYRWTVHHSQSCTMQPIKSECDISYAACLIRPSQFHLLFLFVCTPCRNLLHPVRLHIRWDTPSVIPFLKTGTWPLSVNPTLKRHVSHPNNLLYRLKSWVCNPNPVQPSTVHDNKETPVTSLTYAKTEDIQYLFTSGLS